MNDIKNRRIYEQRKGMTIILIISAAICFFLRFIVDNEDLQMTFLIVGSGLTCGLIVARLFKGSFGYKPTIEEIEEIQFEKKNNNSNAK